MLISWSGSAFDAATAIPGDPPPNTKAKAGKRLVTVNLMLKNRFGVVMMGTSSRTGCTDRACDTLTSSGKEGRVVAHVTASRAKAR